MVTEDVYFQMMKNCSNWNSRNEEERRKRYPIIDAQTGTAQRPSQIAIRTVADRYPAATPTQVRFLQIFQPIHFFGSVIIILVC